jgi:cellobiose-specific phosphotransferase system component IIA
VSDNVPAKIKQTLAQAGQAADRREDQLDQAAQKVEPQLHDARERLEEAERKLAEADRNHTKRVTTSHRSR